MRSHYNDNEIQEALYRQSQMTPGWYIANWEKKPCECDKTQHVPVKLAEHTGYSDSYMKWLQCPKCKRDWVYYLEG